MPYNGMESVAYAFIVEKLLALRGESLAEQLKDQLEIVKDENFKYKSLTDEDVWFSYAEVKDETSLSFHFLILTFDIRE